MRCAGFESQLYQTQCARSSIGNRKMPSVQCTPGYKHSAVLNAKVCNIWHSVKARLTTKNLMSVDFGWRNDPPFGGIGQRRISADSESKNHDKTICKNSLTKSKYGVIYFYSWALPYHCASQAIGRCLRCKQPLSIYRCTEGEGRDSRSLRNKTFQVRKFRQCLTRSTLKIQTSLYVTRIAAPAKVAE